MSFKKKLLCANRFYLPYEDYCLSLAENYNMELIIYDDSINHSSNDEYICINDIPTGLRQQTRKLGVIYGEQLCHPETLTRFQLFQQAAIPSWCHDLTESRLVSAMYLPYPITPTENDRLKQLINTTPKIYDVCTCGFGPGTSYYRIYIVEQLRQRGVSVTNASGWGDSRDRIIATGKLLINIHYGPQYTIFEHLRCDRWLFAGMPVITQNSISDDELDVKDLLVIRPYDQLVDTIVDYLNHYEDNMARFTANLNRVRSSLIAGRNNCLPTNFFSCYV
jgi:hypothetical protein